MRSDTSRLPLVLAALVGGLALFVAGFFIAAEMRSAGASPAAAVTGSGCYTNWNADTCSAGYTAVETGVWTTIFSKWSHGTTTSTGGGGPICATDKGSGTPFTGSEAITAYGYTYGIEH